MSDVQRLLHQLSVDPSALTMLREKPEELGQTLGLSSSQTAALMSANRFDRSMRPTTEKITFETGSTFGHH